MTDYAEHLILLKLERFKESGYDPVDCVNQSIEFGYQGVFEPRAQPERKPLAKPEDSWIGMETGRKDPRCSEVIEGERCKRAASMWPGNSKKGYCTQCDQDGWKN